MRTVSALLLSSLISVAIAEVPNNPEPCTDWQCVTSAWVTAVTVTGPVKLKVNESGTWTATATTTPGKQVCTTSGAERECPVTGIDWSISAGDQSNHTNTITRSFPAAGTYIVSATATPRSDCCPGSGTSGTLTVVVACEAPADKEKITYTGDEIDKVFKALVEKLELLPCVTKAKGEVVVSGSLELGMECCPGASTPTPYKKGKLDCMGSISMEFMPPPPFAFHDVVWIPVGTPGYFGDPWILASIKETTSVGPYGALSVDVSILSDEIKWGECGNCLKLAFGPILKGKVGVKGEASLDIWLGEAIEGKADYSLSAIIDANGNATYKMQAWVKIGSAADCKGWDVNGCFDGLRLEFKAQLKVKGLGSISIAKEFGPYAKDCK